MKKNVLKIFVLKILVLKNKRAVIQLVSLMLFISFR